MAKQKKICFVIMGFGKKSEPSTGKTLDLDKTYKNIIQPAVVKCGYQCIRADEIQDAGLIDRSMYALLMHADLVVADISTSNPNAIYELGVRHAVKPYSTIVIKEKDGKIPFDLDHTRTFHYSHLGEDIGADEAARCQDALAGLIEKAGRSFVDSPLYSYIKDVTPPKLPRTEYKAIIDELAEREVHVFALVEKAKRHMDEGDFIEASKLWERASKTVPTEDYFIQQHALSIYKSKHPSEMVSLSDSLNVIEQLDPDGDTNDPETLGITGAIYKRLYLASNDQEYLSRAIKYYGKGFNIRRDYYTGENYATCLDMMARIEEDDDEKVFHRVAAKRARREIIKILERVEIELEEGASPEYKWAYATLANCFYSLGEDDLGEKYEAAFYSVADVEWEKDTFLSGKAQVLELTRGN